MADNIVAKLKELLELAEAGEVNHLAYHHNAGDEEKWGFLNVSDRGGLLIAARLGALALNDDTKEAGSADRD